LTNFENKNPEDIITNILHNIKNVKIGTLKKEQFVRQLGLLSKIRNLKTIVNQLSNKMMAIKFLVEDDIFYKNGMEKGLEKKEMR
jgi:hypothetical protein